MARLKKQKQVSQNSSKVDENIEQVNNGLVEELKIKIKLLENENKFLREERDNNKNLLETILDHNNSLLKHNEALHQNPYLSKPLSGTTDKTSTDIFINKLPADVSKKIQSKKGSKESNENVISSDSNKNANQVVYILCDSMAKHVNGRNVSDFMNDRVRSHPSATTEDLIDYVKQIARKKQKCWLYT